MTSPIKRESPMEFFKERIEQALVHQHVESSEDTAYYLTQLLDDFVCPERRYGATGIDPDQPLAEVFCEAITSYGHRRFELLKLTGDRALFISGFFSESLNRKIVSTEYYVRLGGRAYAVIQAEQHRFGEIFGELAERFETYADVLSEVSETCALTDDRNLLRLYQRWIETGSQRSAEKLREQGIMVVPASNQVH